MDRKIKKLIHGLDVGSLKAFSWLDSGYVSHAYQIDTTSGSYVLLEQKKGSDQDENYKYQYAVLKCLENKKYRYAPKPVHVSDDGRTLLTTKVPGMEINKLSGLSAADKKTIAINMTEALMALRVIEPDDLKQTLKEAGLKMPPPLTEERAWDKYVINTFFPYKEMAPEHAHTEWLNEQITSYEVLKADATELHFTHGDTTPANVLIDDDFNVVFIDWALAIFSLYEPGKQDFELSYSMNHIPMMNELSDYILDYVAKKQKVDLGMLKNVVFHRRKSIKIADIAWAFKMYAQASKGRSADEPEVYKKILGKRITEYKKEFV